MAVDGGQDRPASGPQHGGKDQHTRRSPQHDGQDHPAACPEHNGQDRHARLGHSLLQHLMPSLLFLFLIFRGCYSMMGNWDYVKLHEKITYDSVHSCILNSMKFDTSNDGVLYTASSDGTISSTDLDTGIGSPLLNLNPEGWSIG
ncbi:hypothetical protein ZWY2020_021148 [Hordeum vulgare]|nr:hypothetical protein ZWY2020_021148 [Hordeum vulgare]